MLSPLDRPRLMLVTDRHRGTRALLDDIDAAVAGGVDVVQIREKDLSPADRRDLASEIVHVCSDRAAVVINSDLTTAIALRIGLHLPDRPTDPGASSRAQLAPDALVGQSIHSIPTHHRDHLDYLLLGHVFATRSKPALQPLGVRVVNRAARASPIPIWAIGGISAENVADVVAAGAAGAAVIGAIIDADDPYLAAHRLRTAMDSAARSQPAQTENNIMTQPAFDQITIALNGKPTPLPSGTTIDQFLADRELQGKLVVVEINGAIVPRPEFLSRQFAPGDTVEIVHFVGGG